MIWLWMERHTSLFENHPRLLHIAPEQSLMNYFRASYGTSKDYITADIESPLADQHFDVQNIPLGANSVDVIICNHLLEHVEDDRRAMRELYRIMRPGGWGIMLVPEDREREHTYEDDSIRSAHDSLVNTTIAEYMAATTTQDYARLASMLIEATLHNVSRSGRSAYMPLARTTS